MSHVIVTGTLAQLYFRELPHWNVEFTKPLLQYNYNISLKAGLEAWGTEAEPAEKETAEVDSIMVTFSSRVIEFWNVEHEIERFMWFQQVLTRHVTPFIFTVNSHNYRISMFNVTIHAHYNCQMWESSVISEIPTNPTKKRTSDSKQEYWIQLWRTTAQRTTRRFTNERLHGRVLRTE